MLRWMNKLLGEGFKKELTVEDLYEVRKEDRSRLLGDRLERCVTGCDGLEYYFCHSRDWMSEVQASKEGTESKPPPKPRLAKAIFKSFGRSYICLGGFTFLEECIIRVYQPIFMGSS